MFEEVLGRFDAKMHQSAVLALTVAPLQLQGQKSASWNRNRMQFFLSCGAVEWNSVELHSSAAQN